MRTFENSVRAGGEIETPRAHIVSPQRLTTAITKYQSTLYRVALRMLRNHEDAEDAVQDALLLAYRKLSQFKGHAQMTTWLVAIVLNSARMLLRRRSSRGMMTLPQMVNERTVGAEQSLADGRPSPEELYATAERRQKLEHASQRLSPTARSAFRLVMLKGFSIREAARKLGVSDGTIRARLFHARRQLIRSFGGLVPYRNPATTRLSSTGRQRSLEATAGQRHRHAARGALRATKRSARVLVPPLL